MCSTMRVGTRYVLASCVSRRDLLATAIPQFFDHSRVEVAERRVHYCGLHVTEYPSSADDVEVKPSKAKLFSASDCFWGEVKRSTDVTGLLRNG
jgi:hypothetical protein